MNLSKNTDVIQLSGLSDAATFTSTAISLTGAEGCLFLVSLSTAADASSAITVSLTGSTALAGTYVTYGPSQTLASTNNLSKNNRCLALDLYKPLKGYAKVVVAGGSSGTTYLNGIVAVKYSERNPGSSDGFSSTTADSTTIISPTSS